MRHSIKTKLFLVFAGILAVFLLAGTLLSTLFLQRYYIVESKRLLAEVERQVESVLNESKGKLQSAIEAIDRTESISIAVASADETVEYTSYPRKDAGDARLPREISSLIELGGPVAFGTVSAGEGAASRIAYAARTSSGGWIVLTKQLKGVAESAAIANRFFFLSGVIALLLGGLVVYFFSCRIVRPVLEMNETAKNIANLRFEPISDIRSNDELGELAQSMNAISEKLKISIDSLKREISYQKQLTRDTSHELKTPLGVIKGYAEGLIYGVADDPDAIREYCKTIVTECDRMDELVKEMLELATLEASSTVPQRAFFPAGRLIADVMECFRPLFTESGIHCASECAEGVTLHADYSMMKRGLENLVTNAVRYNDANRYVRISAQEVGGRVRLSVYNTGTGVPEEELPHIWNAFYKVDKARTRELGGHGLGLSIVKSIAELHGGEVRAENRAGGIEFSILV